MLGLSAGFWLLLLGAGLALTRRQPPFAGLLRLLPPALGALMAICLLLCVPGMRPVDITFRSQLSLLSRADISREQVQSVLIYLLNTEQDRAKAELTGLKRDALPKPARAELQRLDKLGPQEYIYASYVMPPAEKIKRNCSAGGLAKRKEVE